jgi:ferritin-like protein
MTLEQLTERKNEIIDEIASNGFPYLAERIYHDEIDQRGSFSHLYDCRRICSDDELPDDLYIHIQSLITEYFQL